MKNTKLIKLGDENYPKQLEIIENPPKQLYVKGNEKILKEYGIAIIGSRNCSEYGKQIAKKFARDLSKAGINIVSGMAVGIDTCAHIGCLSVKGKTIAVIGSGFNYIYPKENEKLFKKIIETGGAVVTEYPPETKAKSSNFPERNRIVSGLSIGVLVVEARYRSGTSITASIARRQAKKVFCIPSNLESKCGVGTNRLIKRGAKLVTNVDDIIEEYEFIKNNKVNKQIEEVEYEEIEIKSEYKKIYNLLTKEPKNINEICRETKEDINTVSSKLMLMQLEGYITQLPGNQFVKI